MRIGIDARFIGGPSSGLAQYSENLLLALSQLDSENEYVVFVNSALNRKLKVGDNFRMTPVQGRPLSARGLMSQRLALRAERLDLLHAHFPLAPLRLNCPTMITVHDVAPFSRGPDYNARFPVWDRIGGWLLYPSTMRRSRWIVCVSHATRDHLVEIFPETSGKIIVLGSGVEDLYRTKTAPSTGQLIRAHLKIPEKYLLYSGSISESKNIPRMIEAFATWRKQNPRAEEYRFILDLTGELKGIGALRATIAQYGSEGAVWIMTGLTTEERHVLFESAALLFMATKKEGFGLGILKAQLSEVPVLAADSGALPEVVGEGGLLVDPDNSEEMVRMLEQALFDTELRKYLISKGLRNTERYSWHDTARQVRQIYELLF